jgi:hypothetical protein
MVGTRSRYLQSPSILDLIGPASGHSVLYNKGTTMPQVVRETSCSSRSAAEQLSWFPPAVDEFDGGVDHNSILLQELAIRGSCDSI